MYYYTKEFLERTGYKRYEISNYAKDGYECRHNIGYWKRVEYLGFGIGAASLFKGERFSNTSNINRYMHILEKEDVMNADEVWKALNENIETLTQKDEMEEFMFLGLRMTDGVSKSDFKKIFNCDIEAVYGNVIEKLANQNLIKEAGDLITLTDKGIDISNIVLANFLL